MRLERISYPGGFPRPPLHLFIFSRLSYGLSPVFIV